MENLKPEMNKPAIALTVLLCCVSFVMGREGLKAQIRSTMREGLAELSRTIDPSPRPAQMPAKADPNAIPESVYNQIQNGMTYEEVVRLIGRDGERQSASSGPSGYTSEIYHWEWHNGFGNGLLSAQFSEGRLIRSSFHK